MDAEELNDEINAAANTEDRLQLSLILSQRLGIQSNLRQDEAESILHGYWGRAPKCGPDVPRDGITAIGLDVGGVDDPFALAFVTRRDDGVHEVRIKQFLTRNGYDRAGSKNQPVYDEAIEQKTLEIHETVGGIELAVFAECKRMMSGLSNSLVIGGDEHGGVAGFSSRFSNEVCEFKSVPQRDYIMGSALTALESLLADGRLAHQHCPLLNENVQNLSITESDGNGRKLRKRDAGLSGQGYAKIDGIVATIIGVKLVGEENTFDAAAMMG
jgi:phage terminase large subunit-like protein